MSLPNTSLDLSAFGLFLRADIFVQIIMVGLIIASIVCWAIIIDKTITLKKIRRDINEFENLFWSGISLDKVLKEKKDNFDDPMSIMFVSAMNEWRQPTVSENRLLERIERSMNLVLNKEMDNMDSRMAILASIGSASPFIGLLGTVWGIMHSFTAIAISKQTSLTVVAPGIAEALFATALGLFAAIPATIAYNKLSSDVDKINVSLETFMGEFVGIMSRRIGNKK